MQALKRLYRHLWAGEREVRRAFPLHVLSHVEQAVARSERKHHGELRIVIEGGLGWQVWREPVPPRERALALFSSLRVWDTEANSGVLIYLLMAEHRLEIVADRGIHNRVGDAGWQAVVVAATARFRDGEHEAGLLGAVEAISDLVSQHFPAQAGNPDELTNRPLIL